MAPAPVPPHTERRLRLLVAGNTDGRLEQLYQQVSNQQKRRPDKFDVLFAVGSFLPGSGEGAAEAAAVLAEYVCGKRETPIETYFIEGRSAALIQANPEGRELFTGCTFLGGFGIRDINGLRVAYLSGHYSAETYIAQMVNDTGPAFVGAAYTPHAIRSLVRLARHAGAPPIDLLLTAEWPSQLLDRLEEGEMPKDPEKPQADLRSIGATPVAELCAALEPRYHIVGNMDLFFQRRPFQTLNSGHVCRCIALGKVGSKGKARTWVHGLSLNPAAEMTQTALMQRPENTTPFPFAASVKRLASEMDDPWASEQNEE